MTDQPTTDIATHCAYPGCTNPPAPTTPGAGRPTRYCAQEIDGRIHNRQNARTARQAQAAEASGSDITTTEPATMARAQAALLVERLEAALAGHTQLLTQTLEQVRTMGDPAAVQAELTSVTTSARAETEQARAEAAAAEQARIAAEAARAAAEADRADADDAAAEAEAARDAAMDVARAARETADAATAELRGAREKIERLHTDLGLALTRAVNAAQEAEKQAARASSAEADRDRLAGELAAASARAEQETERADREAERADREAARASSAEAAVERHQRRIEELLESRAQARTELAVTVDRLAEVTSDLEESRTQVSVLQRDQAVASRQHVVDIAAIADLRGELDAVGTARGLAEDALVRAESEITDLKRAREYDAARIQDLTSARDAFAAALAATQEDRGAEQGKP